MNFRLPVFLDVSGKRCLVTGEGFEVPAKVEALVKAGAIVTYVNPHADARIQELNVDWQRRDFLHSDLDGCFLVIADTEENPEIFGLAEKRGILCNCVDDPEHCRFSFGSVHRQGDLTFAISTNGWAPALAVRMREWLESEIGPEYAAFLDLMKQARPKITAQIPEFSARKQLWYELMDSNVLKLLRERHSEEAQTLLAHILQSRGVS